MRAKLAIFLLLFCVSTPFALADGVKSNPNNPLATQVDEIPVANEQEPALAGDQDNPLQNYDPNMVLVAQRFSAVVASLTDAVQKGELSKEEGQRIVAEQYLIAHMQIALMSAWREMLPPVPANQENLRSESGTDAIQVALPLPLSSLVFDTSLVQYLDLTPSQTEDIEKLMVQERNTLQPLVAEMQTTTQQLPAAGVDHAAERDIQGIADRQAQLLAEMIVADAQTEMNIYKLLTPEQQQKLEQLKENQGAIDAK